VIIPQRPAATLSHACEVRFPGSGQVSPNSKLNGGELGAAGAITAKLVLRPAQTAGARWKSSCLAAWVFSLLLLPPMSLILRSLPRLRPARDFGLAVVAQGRIIKPPLPARVSLSWHMLDLLGHGGTRAPLFPARVCGECWRLGLICRWWYGPLPRFWWDERQRRPDQ
jgi:hypothetical protein